ncbi:hypothetical protein MRB53_023372 [Persea americana]|uniref:Uncharacterized protein n=2 Tax=Persea americana TaxID=3435 RepID=A0ACC2L9C0_PERAE|nr:hypothetical protein MRB53_023366 [Persea americana]KAJ8630049.1 hypothetical protein MRB53_023372 [Persea americana]
MMEPCCGETVAWRLAMVSSRILIYGGDFEGFRLEIGAHSLHRHCLVFWGPLGNHLLSLHLFSDRCDSSKTHMLDGGLDYPLIDRTIRFINKFSVFGLLALIPFGSSKNHKLKSFTFRSFKFKFLWMMERSTDGGKESVMMLI